MICIPAVVLVLFTKHLLYGLTLIVFRNAKENCVRVSLNALTRFFGCVIRTVFCFVCGLQSR